MSQGRGHLLRSGRSVRKSMPKEKIIIQSFADAPILLVGQNLNHNHHHKESIHENEKRAFIIIYKRVAENNSNYLVRL